jgi:hypothetical protein
LSPKQKYLVILIAVWRFFSIFANRNQNRCVNENGKKIIGNGAKLGSA